MPSCVRVALPGDVPFFKTSAARAIAANDSYGGDDDSLSSLRVSNVTVSINATLKVHGVPMPTSAAGVEALRSSFAVAAFAATGLPNIRVVGVSSDSSNAIQILVQWEVASSLTSDVPLNHTVSANNEADLDDVRFFTETNANATVERLRSFAAALGATAGAPRIDCSDSPAITQASILCMGWRATQNLTTTGRRDQSNGDTTNAPGFALVLSESIVQSGGAPLELSDFNASALEVTIVMVLSNTFVDPPAPQPSETRSVFITPSVSSSPLALAVSSTGSLSSTILYSIIGGSIGGFIFVAVAIYCIYRNHKVLSVKRATVAVDGGNGGVSNNEQGMPSSELNLRLPPVVLHNNDVKPHGQVPLQATWTY
jgi:hypothetical protein